MRCIAIDDEPKALEVIERYCAKIHSVSLRATFREALKALEFLVKEEIDLIFLDINMPEINGFGLISSLSQKPLIIFTTAYSNHAVESYNLRAVDYLLKPITFERFLASVNKAQELYTLKNKMQPVSGFVLIKSGSQTHKIKVDDILLLQKNGNYLTIVTKEKRILMRGNISDAFDIIPQQGFIQIHKSYIVSLQHISTLEVHQVTVGNHKIPIGSFYRDELKKQIGL